MKFNLPSTDSFGELDDFLSKYSFSWFTITKELRDIHCRIRKCMDAYYAMVIQEHAEYLLDLIPTPKELARSSHLIKMRGDIKRNCSRIKIQVEKLKKNKSRRNQIFIE